MSNQRPTIPLWEGGRIVLRLVVVLVVFFGGMSLLSRILMPPGSQFLIPQTKSKIGHSSGIAREAWTNWRNAGGSSQDLQGFADSTNALNLKTPFLESNPVKAEARENEVLLYFRDGPELPLYDPTNGVLSKGAIAFAFSRSSVGGPLYLSGPSLEGPVQVERAFGNEGAPEPSQAR